MMPDPVEKEPPVAILVVVPTFRRAAWVRELLDAVGEQLASVPGSRILVLDNDPDGSARALEGHPLVSVGRAVVEHVGAGDVVSVRNVALDRARELGAEALVMIDDDELPAPGWLAALVGAARARDVDVVAGPILQEEAVLQRPHAAALLVRKPHPAGPFKADVPTGNVLVRGALLHTSGLRFHPALGRSGGEDTLFFRQAADAGASFWWAEEAAVRERVAPERLTRRALVLRAYRNGRSSAVVERLQGRPSRRLVRVLVMVGAAGAHLPRSAARGVLGDRTGAWRFFYKVVRHVGRAGLSGDRRQGAVGGGYGGN